jgi:uncharacterized protein DUF2381
MTRSIVRVLVAAWMVMGQAAAAQADCHNRLSPWNPQRRAVWYLRDRNDQAPPKLHVAHGVATVLVFPDEEVKAARILADGEAADGGFAPLEVGRNSVLILPRRDLSDVEHFTVAVALKNGPTIPFSLVTPLSDQGSDGQVDVFTKQENPETLQQAMEVMRDQVDRLSGEIERRDRGEVSVDGALAGVLAAGKEDLSPFTEMNAKLISDGHTSIKVVLYKRRSPRLKLDRAAVVFTVTNQGTAPFELDQVRLSAEPYNMGERPYALRAQKKVIAPGDSGRFAVVIPADALQVRPKADLLVLELWRAGSPQPDKVASVELVEGEDPSAPLQFLRRVPAAQ